MSEEAASEQPSDNLQFDHAETDGSPGSPSCALCNNALVSEYHELNGAPICMVCRAREEERFAADGGWGRLFTAGCLGFGAAVLGSIVYWGFTKLTGFELGLMAIAVGWLVGKAVMKGSNYRGGRKYQILAVALTYFSITFSYIPYLFEAAGKQAAEEAKKNPESLKKSVAPAATDPPLTAGTAAIAVGALALVILAAPFLAGFSNVIGWFIIAFGLWEAWKFTRKQPFELSGPHVLAERKTE